jgi:hypothetical protein
LEHLYLFLQLGEVEAGLILQLLQVAQVVGVVALGQVMLQQQQELLDKVLRGGLVLLQD